MPFRDLRTYLEDIVESSESIMEFTAGMDYAAYASDLKTKRAVERLLQIVSEAAYRLGGDAERLCPTIDWRGVRGLGNVLRHEYHAVDDERVWRTLKEKLPELYRAAAVALTDLQPPGAPDPA